MEEKKEKRVLRIELDDDVKKVSITGKNGEEKVVMSQELNEDDLDQVAGGHCLRRWRRMYGDCHLLVLGMVV